MEELVERVRELNVRHLDTSRQLERKRAKLRQIDAAFLAHHAAAERQAGPCSAEELDAGLTESEASQSPPADFTPDDSECGSDETTPPLLSDSESNASEDGDFRAKCEHAIGELARGADA